MTDAGKRGVDVFAVTQMPSVPSIDGGRNATSKGDVRAHEGTKGQIVQAEGVSGCGKHSPGGQHTEAGEDEGVVAADGSSDSTAGDGGKESEDEDSDRGGEHRCSFVRAGVPRSVIRTQRRVRHFWATLGVGPGVGWFKRAPVHV